MRLRPILFGSLVVLIFLAPVVVAQATGTWETMGRAGAGPGGGEDGAGGWRGGDGQGAGAGGGVGDPGVEEREGAGGGGPGGGGPGGGNGSVTRGDARGWMTLAQVAEANGITLAEILDAFGLPPDTDPVTELRDLESAGFSVAALRAWLAERGTR